MSNIQRDNICSRLGQPFGYAFPNAPVSPRNHRDLSLQGKHFMNRHLNSSFWDIPIIQWIVYPPSTTRFSPFIILEASLARNNAAHAISTGLQNLPHGVFSMAF